MGAKKTEKGQIKDGGQGPTADRAGIMRRLSDVLGPAELEGLELSLEQLEVIHSLLDAIDHLNDELAIANGKIDRLETLADEDVLVPMLNRRAFVRALVRLHSFGERYGFDTALLYFDLNSFKAINDDYGHGAGDAVLRSVGAFLCDNVRQSDVVGRLGGDEFAIVLPSATLALAERKGEELAAGIAQLEIPYDGRILRTSAAFGAHALSAEEDVETALQSVDQAMYANKTRDR